MHNKLKYQFILPFPPSLNSYYRCHQGRVIISVRGRTYRKEVQSIIKYLQPIDTPIKGIVHVTTYLYCPDRRIRDADNFDGKAPMDALTHSGVWDDDSQVKSSDTELIDYDDYIKVEPHKKGKAVITIRLKNW